MIRTEYKVELEIDGKSFSIVAINPSQEQSSGLEEETKGHNLLIDKRDEQSNELSYLQKAFALNDKILSDETTAGVPLLLVEQKELNSKIFELQKDIKVNAKDMKKSSKSLNEVYKKRFGMTVSGEDKAALQAEIEKKEITYFAVTMSIAELIRKSLKKKSKT